MDKWEQLYTLLGIKDFIYFISSPSIQDSLFGIKLVFIFFTLFFFAAVMYFYFNSSYIQYQFLQDVTEFFFWQAYGLREINRRWKKIMKKTESGAESDYKLAIIDADDFLQQTLENRDYRGETFEDLVNAAGKKVPNIDAIIQAHAVRNSIVYEPDFRLEIERAKGILYDYENAIKGISVS